MALKLTPTEAADKQIRNIKAALPQIEAGIAKVSVNPCELAVAQQEKMKIKLIESIDNGKWARGLGRVSLEDWKRVTTEKIKVRLGSGATAARPKLIKFYTEFFPYVETVQNECKAMSNLSIDDAIAIAGHNIRRLSEFKRS